MIINKKHFKDTVNENQYTFELYKDKTTGDLNYRNQRGIVVKVADGGGLEVGDNLALSGNLTVDGTTTLNGTLVLGDAAGDTIAVAGTITTSLVFEGTTDDAFEITLNPGDPTADRVVTLPDLTGTVVVTEGAQTVNGTKTFGSPVLLPAGLVGAPSIGIGTADTGLYEVSGTQTGFAQDGVLVAMFDTNGIVTNEINEQIGGNGVTIDGTLLKDGGAVLTGTFVTNGTTTSSGASAVAITGTIHEITTTGTGDALTLVDGAEGQILHIVYVAEGAGADTAVLTPTNLAGADTTITFNDLGDTASLLFTTGTWFGIGAKDAVFA